MAVAIGLPTMVITPVLAFTVLVSPNPLRMLTPLLEFTPPPAAPEILIGAAAVELTMPVLPATELVMFTPELLFPTALAEAEPEIVMDFPTPAALVNVPASINTP